MSSSTPRGFKGQDTGRSSPSQQSAVHVSLVIRGFEGDPGRITEAVGIIPTVCGRRGEPRINAAGRETGELNKDSFWSLRSSAPPDQAVQTHIESILDVVEPHSRRMRRLPRSMVRRVYCTIIPGESVPLVVMSSSVLSRLAKLDVEVVIDVLSIVER